MNLEVGMRDALAGANTNLNRRERSEDEFGGWEAGCFGWRKYEFEQKGAKEDEFRSWDAGCFGWFKYGFEQKVTKATKWDCDSFWKGTCRVIGLVEIGVRIEGGDGHIGRLILRRTGCMTADKG